MGATTTPDALPYPDDNDPPDVPGDIQGLAVATQNALNSRTTSINTVQSNVDAKVLYGPVANVPGSLQPGQLYCGY